MPLDAKKQELRRGDTVTLKAVVEHVHEQLVSVRIMAPQGQYEPTITMAPGCMEKTYALLVPAGQPSTEEVDSQGRPLGADSTQEKVNGAN